jgi:hypothetical protein
MKTFMVVLIGMIALSILTIIRMEMEEKEKKERRKTEIELLRIGVDPELFYQEIDEIVGKRERRIRRARIWLFKRFFRKTTRKFLKGT